MIHLSSETFNSAHPGTAFLGLRWNEFFDLYTIDTFQPRLSNLPSLVEEILELCKNGPFKGWEAYLAALQDELKPLARSSLDRDWISSFDAWKIDELCKAKNCHDAAQLARILCGSRLRSCFEERIFEEALMLPEKLPKEKETADIVLGQLATIALHRGYVSPPFKAVLKSFERDPREWIEGLLRRLGSTPQKYHVFIEVCPTSKISQQKLIPVLKEAGFTIHEPKDFDNLELSPTSVLISREESGTSPSGALQAALRRLDPVLDMLAFYLADRAANLPSHGWTGKTVDQLSKTVVPTQTLRLVQPHSNADQLVIHALRANSGSRFSGSVSNALELHSTAMRALDVRTRFLNLWAALECLAALVEGPSIYQKVVNLVCPIVTWRKVDKVARYTAINLHLWRKASDQLDNKPKCLPGTTSDRVPAHEVLTALCKPDKHADILELFGVASGHPLLLFRLHSAWKIFSNPVMLADDLNRSRERLGWHIRRIYRGRNLLVHQGQEPEKLESLCDNLHYYVSSVLSRVIHGVSQSDEWKPAEAARHWCQTGEYFFEHLKKSPEILTLENIMPNPTSDMGEVHPWNHLNRTTNANADES